jgi:hypothetical protein
MLLGFFSDLNALRGIGGLRAVARAKNRKILHRFCRYQAG